METRRAVAAPQSRAATTLEGRVYSGWMVLRRSRARFARSMIIEMVLSSACLTIVRRII
jgi:hypothetical protein